MTQPDPLTINRLNIHQVTLSQCGFKESIECLSRHGVMETALWLPVLDETGTTEARRILEDNDVAATSVCPGGLLTSAHAGESSAILDRNRRWLEQAAEVGAASMVTLTGGLPEEVRDLEAMRSQAVERLAGLIPEARSAGVRLALEPLHPIVCGFRSVISTLGEALDILDQLDAEDVMGIAFDTYALWWEASLEEKIARAAPRILNVHASDWLRDTMDVRVDRGMPGDGLIDNRRIRGWLEQAGFSGPIEVEIFSARNWWKRPPDEVVKTIVDRSAHHL